MTALEKAILKHIGLYRLTLPETLTRLFFAGEPAQQAEVLGRLQQAGYIQEQPFDARHSYYTITRKAVSEVSLPNKRDEIKEGAFHKHLATLWFCCMDGPHRRHRLEPTELQDLFGEHAPAPQKNYALGQDKDGPCVFCLYEVSTTTREAIKAVRKQLHRAQATPVLGDWLRTGRYGFALLGADRDKVDDLKRVLAEPVRRQARLTDQAKFLVRLGPTPETLAEACADLDRPDRGAARRASRKRRRRNRR